MHELYAINDPIRLYAEGKITSDQFFQLTADSLKLDLKGAVSNHDKQIGKSPLRILAEELELVKPFILS